MSTLLTADSEESREHLDRVAENLEGRHPEEIVSWALGAYHPSIALASSFGMEDVALIHMLMRVRRDARVFYIDTGLLFPETYDTRDRLEALYGVTFTQILPHITLYDQSVKYGEALWARDPDLCTKLRKVEPLNEALGGLTAWITGIRRDQTPQRANAKVVEWDARHALVKVNPLAAWKAEDVRQYVNTHQVPYNPLHDLGYPSVGCATCTDKVAPGEDPRSGRWRGFSKTECGLHFDTPATPI